MNPYEVSFRERETLEFEKFPTSSTCGYWQLKFRTEFCSGSCHPSDTKSWIRENEAAQTADDLDECFKGLVSVWRRTWRRGFFHDEGRSLLRSCHSPRVCYLSDVIFKAIESCCNRIEFVTTVVTPAPLSTFCLFVSPQLFTRLPQNWCCFLFLVEGLWPHQPGTVDSSQRLRHSKKNDLKMSQSMTANQYPNFEMLDVKAATTFKKSSTNTNFKKKVFVEEQKV